MEVEMVVGRGEVRDEVIDYVESIKADLLIIGTRELGALKRYQHTFIP
jgi:nucleotide-binding universal stress UspA family protein